MHTTKAKTPQEAHLGAVIEGWVIEGQSLSVSRTHDHTDITARCSHTPKDQLSISIEGEGSIYIDLNGGGDNLGTVVLTRPIAKRLALALTEALLCKG